MFVKLVFYLKNCLATYHFKLILANLICGLFPDFYSGSIRATVYRLAGFKLGPGCFIMKNLALLSGQPNFYQKLDVGANVLISTHITINLDEKVTLEDNVTLSPFVRIYTGTHAIGSSSRRCTSEAIAKPVVIERGSWVALGATILPGVRVGYGSVVAAGAIVTKDVPPNSFVAGIPAQLIKKLPESVTAAPDPAANGLAELDKSSNK